jgi:hypothetical protein
MASILSISWGIRTSRGSETLVTELRSLSALTQLPSKSLARVPITQANLLCTEGLSSGGASDIPAAEATVKSWAEHVKSETERHLYRFQQRPSEYENSPGFFRMLMLAVVLAEDYNIHYDEARRGGPGSASAGDRFFSRPESVFLSGLLGPERKGTCSSMPVLYVAIGRELGYPLKLVTTKGHLFVRWEGEGERFNVEATSHGLNRFDDDYYRHWPLEVTQSEEAAEGYLKSLSPAEELAAFLSIRGMCLRQAARTSEAAEAFAAAVRLAPGCHSYRQVWASLQGTGEPNKSTETRSSTGYDYANKL